MYWVPENTENEIKSILKSSLYKYFTDLSEQEAEYLFSIAYSDFINYVAVTRDFIFDENYEEETLVAIQYIYHNQPLVLNDMLSEWLEVWSLKWKQRVKLAVKEDESSKINEEVEKKVQGVLPSIPELYEWFKRYAIGSLIRHGEVCFTGLLAETVVKEIIVKMLFSQDPAKALRFLKENPAFVLNEITKKVKELSAYRGNLVIVRLNPLFFESQRGEPF